MRSRLRFVVLVMLCLLPLSLLAAQADPVDAIRQRLLKSPVMDTAEFNNFRDACFAAGKPETLVITYKDLVVAGKKGMTESDLSFLNTIYSTVDVNRPTESGYYVCYYIARILTIHHLDKVAPVRYLQQATNIAEKLGDDCKVLKAMYAEGAYYNNIAHDLRASYKICERLDSFRRKKGIDEYTQCGVDINVPWSILYYYLGDYNEALYHLHRSIGRTPVSSKDPHLFDLYVRCYQFYNEMKVLDNALLELDSAYRAIKDMPVIDGYLNNLYADSFNAYVSVGDYLKALPLQKKVDMLRLDVTNDEYYDYLYSLIKLNIHFGEYAAAKANIDHYVADLKEWNIQRWTKAYEVKYQLYKLIGDEKDALAAYEKYNYYNDSVHHQAQNYAILGQEIKYKTQEKEEQLRLQISQTEIASKNAKLIVVIAIGICLCLLLFMAYRINAGLRERERLNRSFAQRLIQNTEKEQNRLATELHDGIGQELLLLKNGLIHDKNVEKVTMVADIIENVRGMARDLYPALLDVVGLKSAIENQLQKIDEVEAIFISAEIDFEGRLNKHTELQVYRIFQEAMNNVLKYSAATSVLVSLSKHEDVIRLTVKDNGVGFDTDAALNAADTFGLRTMQQRAEGIQGKLKITSLKNKGTEVILELPER